MSELALHMRGISRRFGAVEANKGVDLTIASGRVHAVVGENGAGKSTLMKIAYGQVRADAGDIAIKGVPVAVGKHSPTAALERGVGMVHQHFMLVGPLTALENIVLGREGGPVLRLDEVRQELRGLCERFGFAVELDRPIEELSVGEQQRVEILKVLWRGCDVLILDEPTAVLTPGEVEILFSVLRELVEGGATVVLITHKLDEVADFADDITVMRQGQVVATLDGSQATPQEIANAMVGRPVLLQVDKTPAAPVGTSLEVRDLRVLGATGSLAVDGVSLSVGAGEIVGIAGVLGNGQSELCDAIAGLLPVDAGRVRIGGADVTRATVSARYRAGLAHVPEDRHARGLVLEMTVAENLILGRQAAFCRRLSLDRERIAAEAAERIEDADIRPPDPDLAASALSGGNQQKIVVARELARTPKVLVCSQPTRGVDIGAIELIHRRIIAARDAGVAVLLVSAELTELLALSDRLAVLYRGRLVSTLEAHELAAPGAISRVGQLMTGAEVTG